MSQRIRTMVFAGLAALSVIIPAHASLPPTSPPADGFGWLTAESNGAGFPPGSPVALELQWDSGAPLGGSIMNAVRDATRRELIAKGYRIDPSSPYVLRLNVDMPDYAAPIEDDGDEDDSTPWFSENAPPSVVDQWHIPLGQALRVTPATIAIEMTVYNQRGDVLWMATVEAAYRGNHPARLARRIASAAVAAIGTDTRRDFVLSCDHGKRSGGICLG